MTYLDLTEADDLTYQFIWDTAVEMRSLDEPLWQDIGTLLLMVINDYEQRHPRDRRRQAFDAAKDVVVKFQRWMVDHGYLSRGD